MLAVAHRRFGGAVELINGSAEALPLASESFDHLTVTHVLRYVADPGATLAGSRAWCVRAASSPRSSSASRGVPLARSGSTFARCRSPAACSGTAGGRSATSWEGRSATSGSATRSSATSRGGTRRPPRGRGAAAELRRCRRHLGTEDVSPPARPAWYALERGGWRDYVTLLHPPYTAWHLSVHRHRRLPGARRRVGTGRARRRLGTARCRRRRVRTRRRGRCARARRTERAAAAHQDPRSGARRARRCLDRGRLRDRRRRRGHLRGLARSSSPSGSSWCWRTTWSPRRGASIRTSGSGWRGAASRAQRLRGRRGRRPRRGGARRGLCGAALARPARARTTCGTCDAG